jgi:transposase
MLAGAGRGSDEYKARPCKLNGDHDRHIRELVTAEQRAGRGVTCTTVGDSLKRTFGLLIDPRRLRYHLHTRIGLTFTKGWTVSQYERDHSEVAARNQQFIREWAPALEEERTGTAVCVYSDESYVNTRHHAEMTWCDPASPQGKQLNTGLGKGARLIILHALTRDGLLVTNDQKTGRPIVVEQRAAGTQLTSELVFQGKEEGDYHKNMNADTWTAWVTNRLLPTFRARYPGKGMRLIIDNAKYHKSPGPNFVNPNAMSRAEMGEQLFRWGVTHWREMRPDHPAKFVCAVRFDKEKDPEHKHPIYIGWGARKSSTTPSNAEMKAKLQRLIETQHPQDRMSRVEEALRSASLEDSKGTDSRFHRVIFTPPYQCEFQPIEKVWSYVKGFVARQYCRNRTPTVLRDHVLQGMYGDGARHTGVTAKLAVKYIEHAKKYANTLIAKYRTAMSGTMDALVIPVVAQPLLFVPAAFDEDDLDDVDMGEKDENVDKMDESE